jgi:FtsZ-binding cell division protein ZapB
MAEKERLDALEALVKDQAETIAQLRLELDNVNRWGEETVAKRLNALADSVAQLAACPHGMAIKEGCVICKREADDAERERREAAASRNHLSNLQERLDSVFDGTTLEQAWAEGIFDE